MEDEAIKLSCVGVALANSSCECYTVWGKMVSEGQLAGDSFYIHVLITKDPELPWRRHRI